MLIVQPSVSSVPLNALPGPGAFQDRLHPIRVAELMTHAPQIHWLVSGLLVQASTTFLAGPFKSLKSGLALDLAISAALPPNSPVRPLFLNRFPCTPMPHVLYFSGEARREELRQRVQAILLSKVQSSRAQPSRSALDQVHQMASQLNLSFFMDTPRMNDPHERQKVCEEIHRTRAGLVIIDPLYLCGLASSSYSSSNLFEMGEFLSTIEAAVLSMGATPVLVHHMVKGIRVGDEPTLADMAFAGSAERAGQWILVNHREPFDPTQGRASLRLHVGGRAGQSAVIHLDIEEGCLQADLTGRRWNVQVQGQPRPAGDPVEQWQPATPSPRRPRRSM
ncbi:MAG: AAA family ATPase [Gemmataceae bacterium]